MPVTRRVLFGVAASVAGAVPARRGRSQQTPVIKVGVLNDQSGVYRDDTGMTSVACAQQAADEMGSSHGFRTEIVYADHQNKPDVGASIARQWYDQGVDLVIDVPTSSV
ncbi:MAG: ABC transporter substrate-binding protein, partial [Acetobacteraceae bacterium]|nr:ABC transporter substrate-binding protein [Acetobacteraceae bacterium]